MAREPIPPPTAVQLQAVAASVAYEMRMFRWAMNEIGHAEFAKGTGGSELDDAAVEVALLHARVLRDFFAAEDEERVNLRKGDVRAFHYIPSWSAPTMHYLLDNKARLDQRLAHLVYVRPTLDRMWGFEVIRKEIEAAWVAFLNALPTDRAVWFSVD